MKISLTNDLGTMWKLTYYWQASRCFLVASLLLESKRAQLHSLWSRICCMLLLATSGPKLVSRGEGNGFWGSDLHALAHEEQTSKICHSQMSFSSFHSPLFLFLMPKHNSFWEIRHKNLRIMRTYNPTIESRNVEAEDNPFSSFQEGKVVSSEMHCRNLLSMCTQYLQLRLRW